MNEKILLIGTGFIAKNIKKYLKKNITQHSSIELLKKKYNTDFDYIIFASGNSSPQLSINDPFCCLNRSVTILDQLLDKYNKSKWILLSTISIYDVQNYGNKKCQPSIYGANKLLAEFCLTNKIKNYAILRLGYVYGKFMQKNFFYDLKNNKSIYLDPLSKIRPINTIFVTKAIESIIRNNLQGAFNLLNPNSLQVSEIIKYFKIESNIMPERVFDDSNIENNAFENIFNFNQSKNELYDDIAKIIL